MTVARRKWGRSDAEVLGLSLWCLAILAIIPADSSGLIGWLGKGVVAVAFSGFLVCGVMANSHVFRRNGRAGGAEMSSKHLATDEVWEARVDAALAGIVTDMASSESVLPAVMSEFELARAFVERFGDAFVVRVPNTYECPNWYFRSGAGAGKPRFAHCEARHACMRMISVLANVSEASGEDRLRLERWRTVEDVLNIASWDPALLFHEGSAEDGP